MSGAAVHWCFLTDMHVRSCVSTFVPLCLRAVSTLAASCTPPSDPLSPSWTPPPPPPTLFVVPEGLMCTTEGHVLGTRARRQAKAAAAPLHLYHLCYSSLSSPSTMVWSGLVLHSVSFLLSALFSLSHFLLISLATFSWVHRARSRFECDCIMEIECEVFDGVTDWRGWFGLSLWSSALRWLGPSLFSCWLYTSTAASSCSASHCLPQWPATWSVWCVQTTPAPAMPGAVGAEGGEMKAGS